MAEHPLLSFGTFHDFTDHGLRLSFHTLEVLNADDDLRDRAREQGLKKKKSTYFRVSALVQNYGTQAQRFSLHYQYQTARVGEDGATAVALELIDDHIYEMTLHPGRKATASFTFAHPHGDWDLVDLESDLWIEGKNSKRLTSTWTGLLGQPTGPSAFPATTVAPPVTSPVTPLQTDVHPQPDTLVSQMEEAIQKRDEARRIVTTNPRLALELGIGDPTRQTGFDDGGVVDINGISAEALAESLRLPLGVAGRIVGTRDQLGGRFSSTEEISLYASLSPREEQLVKERAVILPW
ncbi:hypothetical protein [Streptomyces sp. NPDC003435]